MSRLERFEDLIVWQRARELTKLVYFVTRQEHFDYPLANEVRQMTVTLAGKIASAFETRGSKNSVSMLALAKAACNGFKLQVTGLYEYGLIAPFEYEELIVRAIEIRELLFELEYTFEFWYPEQNDSSQE
ncbi:MAG: four helix bundle protein [Chloroflexi bacterium]|nr:four helix bundle protein [Chloroflexota bacterium]MCC6895755.1 four helix bundle protein [Anaerolineae bacterium]